MQRNGQSIPGASVTRLMQDHLLVPQRSLRPILSLIGLVCCRGSVNGWGSLSRLLCCGGPGTTDRHPTKGSAKGDGHPYQVCGEVPVEVPRHYVHPVRRQG